MAGAGSGSHMAYEFFAELTGIKLLVVHYKGASEALNDLLGGRIDIVFDSTAPSRIESGSAKLPASRSERRKRLSRMPDEGWFGLLAPAGTPAGIVRRLAEAARVFILSPDVSDKLIASAFSVLSRSRRAGGANGDGLGLPRQHGRQAQHAPGLTAAGNDCLSASSSSLRRGWAACLSPTRSIVLFGV